MSILFVSHIRDDDFPKDNDKIKDKDNPFVLFSLSNKTYTPIEKFPTRKHAVKKLQEMKLA